MTFIIEALKIIILLGFLIFIHEGGHFLAARRCKVKVDAFSIGFGPKIWKKQGKETLYSIGIIPFGGYCQMRGEDKKVDEEGSFSNATVYQRIFICLAGPVVNIVFGVIVYFVLGVCSGYTVSTTVDTFLPEAEANLVGIIQSGDKILEVNNKNIKIKSDITAALESYKEGKVKVVVERNNEKVTLYITPTEYVEGYYVLGVVLGAEESGFKDRVYYSFWDTIDYLNELRHSIVRLFTGRMNVNQLSGPIGISSVVANSDGLYDFIYLLCIISISLGVTNLLPVPALDGGRILVYVIEIIRRKPLPEDVELKIQEAGFILLMTFALYISCNDIARIINK